MENEKRLDDLAVDLVIGRYGRGDLMGMVKLKAGVLMELRKVLEGVPESEVDRTIDAFAARYRATPL